MTTSLFEPAPRLTDDLTGAVPTWRLDEQPLYDALVAEWPALYARLCQPVDEPAADVVEGVVLDGPPTVALTLVATQPLDLPATEAIPVRDCDDCDAVPGGPCLTPKGRPRIARHTSRDRAQATA